MPSAVLPDTIKRVAIIDDNARGREAMAEIVQDASLEPIVQTDRLLSLKECVRALTRQADAAICDHRLKPGNYAAFEGADVVAALYGVRFPAILVTAYSLEVDLIRLVRRRIPVVVKGGYLGSQDIASGIRQCLDEFSSVYADDRRPWRTLIRVQSIDQQTVSVVLPAWNPAVALSLPKSLFNASLGQLEAGTRLFGEVNIGASNSDDMYFDKLVLAEKPRGEYAQPSHP